MKNLAADEIANLVYRIDALLDEFDSMDIPADDLRDPVDWISLTDLEGTRNWLVHDYHKLTPDQIQFACENVSQIYKNLTGQLDELKAFSPEYFREKELEVITEPIATRFEANGFVVTVFEDKKKKMSFEKAIRFCSYFFPKKFREEAMGDIFETRHEMIEDGCSKISIFCVTVFKMFSLILGSLRIRLSDLVKTENEMNK